MSGKAAAAGEQPARQARDFAAAFAIGAAVGLTAALVVNAGGRSRRRNPLAGRHDEISMLVVDRDDEEVGGLVTAGRELLEEFREEAARILEEAREELREISRRPAPSRRPGQAR